MDVERTLQRLQAVDVQQLPLAALKTDDVFQPRVGRLVPFREQSGVESRSEEHTGNMRLTLEAALHIQLWPVLVADIAGTLFLVDGHHRLKAYRLAQRETIPARVLPMERLLAALVSKLVNCTERALPMHKAQQLEAAWQYMAAVTRQGTQGLPEGESLRTVVARFSISYGSAHRMLRKIPEVNPREWSAEALDAGTGFPRWRYVREAGAGWHDMKERMDVDQITQHLAAKLARKMGAMMEKAGPAAAKLAVQMLGIEAQLEAVNEDTRDFEAETAEASDF
jgi:hypothetical protein